MADWDDLMAPCPNCQGDGCEVCEEGGKLLVPSKLQEYVTGLRKQLLEMRQTRHHMLETYERWHASTEEQTVRIMEMVRVVYPDLEDTAKGRRAFDHRMSVDIVEADDRLEQLKRTIESGEIVVAQAKDTWRQAKRTLKQRTEKPPPPPPPRKIEKHTKAAGKICRFPNCPKDAREWDEKGRGWCRKHAYQRGLMERPKVEEEDT